MKTLILVSKKPVVVQIFTLVCKQLHISLEVLNEAQIDRRVDIIIVDKEYITDRFNILKSYCRSIGAISKDDLPYDTANDFLIPVPFLPSALYEILDNQITLLDKRAKSKVYVSNVEVPEEDESISNVEDEVVDEKVFSFDNIETETTDETPIDDTSNAVEYLESLADDIASDIKEENDDSIVSMASIDNQGGVLDNKELSNLEDIIKQTVTEQKELENITPSKEEGNEDEWVDLSSIIDQAIDEVNLIDEVGTTKSKSPQVTASTENAPLNILINTYELEQLKPLLSLCDQSTIDLLSDGQEVDIKLKLDNDK